MPYGKIVEAEQHILYVIHPGFNNAWIAKAAQNNETSFESRKNFPKPWAGLTNKTLEEKSGVEGALFCHRNLFLVSAKTKEAVTNLAQLAVENEE